MPPAVDLAYAVYGREYPVSASIGVTIRPVTRCTQTTATTQP